MPLRWVVPVSVHGVLARQPHDRLLADRRGRHPAAGRGRWFERGHDGSEVDWGRVAVWDVPGRVVLIWQVNGDWRVDPALETDVDVTFTEEVPGRTRGDLRHGHLERFGDAAQIRATFESSGGWPGILGRYVTAAEQADVARS